MDDFVGKYQFQVSSWWSWFSMHPKCFFLPSQAVSWQDFIFAPRITQSYCSKPCCTGKGEGFPKAPCPKPVQCTIHGKACQTKKVGIAAYKSDATWQKDLYKLHRKSGMNVPQNHGKHQTHDSPHLICRRFSMAKSRKYWNRRHQSSCIESSRVFQATTGAVPSCTSENIQWNPWSHSAHVPYKTYTPPLT